MSETMKVSGSRDCPQTRRVIKFPLDIWYFYIMLESPTLDEKAPTPARSGNRPSDRKYRLHGQSTRQGSEDG